MDTAAFILVVIFQLAQPDLEEEQVHVRLKVTESREACEKVAKPAVERIKQGGPWVAQYRRISIMCVPAENVRIQGLTP